MAHCVLVWGWNFVGNGTKRDLTSCDAVAVLLYSGRRYDVDSESNLMLNVYVDLNTPSVFVDIVTPCLIFKGLAMVLRRITRSSSPLASSSPTLAASSPALACSSFSTLAWNQLRFEQGPVRPPSEAESLLVRVSRNCPHNKCAFCPLYKRSLADWGNDTGAHARYERRPLQEVLGDIDAMQAAYAGRPTPNSAFLQDADPLMTSPAQLIKIDADLLMTSPAQLIKIDADLLMTSPAQLITIDADSLMTSPAQLITIDADPLMTSPAQLIKIVQHIRQCFPSVERITSYTRAWTLARRKPEDLKELRQAGLDRLHVGLESGCDQVLSMMNKGVDRATQIIGGRAAKEAGFELSEYVMPGLGGVQYSSTHARDTASALAAIGPDFVRLRSCVVVPETLLAEMERQGKWEALGEIETVKEIRAFLAYLAETNVQLRVESDHGQNLLMELRGNFPDHASVLLGICDRFLALAPQKQAVFIIARRLGWTGTLLQFQTGNTAQSLAKSPTVAEWLARLAELHNPRDREQLFATLRQRQL
eukprot:g55185.t1